MGTTIAPPTIPTRASKPLAATRAWGPATVTGTNDPLAMVCSRESTSKVKASGYNQKVLTPIARNKAMAARPAELAARLAR